MAAAAAAYSRVETEEEACETKEEEAALVSNKSYQAVVGQDWASLTPNQLSQLAEFDELNSFRDGVFQCDNNLWPSCVCAFCCPCVHLGQLARRLGVAPAWLLPAGLFSLLLLVYFVDFAATEALYLAAWTLAIWVVRLKVRRYFRACFFLCVLPVRRTTTAQARTPAHSATSRSCRATSTTAASPSGAGPARSHSSRGTSATTNSTAPPASEPPAPWPRTSTTATPSSSSSATARVSRVLECPALLPLAHRTKCVSPRRNNVFSWS